MPAAEAPGLRGRSVVCTGPGPASGTGGSPGTWWDTLPSITRRHILPPPLSAEVPTSCGAERNGGGAAVDWRGVSPGVHSPHPHREVQGPPPSPLSLGPSRSPPGPWVRPRRPHPVGSLWGTWSWLLVDGPGGGDRGRTTAPPRALVTRQAARVSLSHRAQPLPGAPAPACGVSGGLAWASSDLRRLL